MHLINAKTLKLEAFIGSDIPPYAILSHTWGPNEVTFQSMNASEVEEKEGYIKIVKCCQRALQEETPIYYVWVDTCCIDKTSSAELSEAINSMMRIYAQSEICYAYLTDVPPSPRSDINPSYGAFVRELPDSDPILSSFANSRWFTRGWTLQELIAPKRLVFLAQDWTFLFSRWSRSNLISRITGIDGSFLEEREGNRVSLSKALGSLGIAERMSWASNRSTTRKEDEAYSLMGLFGINMPLLYGEGQAAFIRLQEEILKHSDDQSLLAWNSIRDGTTETIKKPKVKLQSVEDSAYKYEAGWSSRQTGILATSPSAFLRSEDYIPSRFERSSPPYSITNKGLSMEVPLIRRNNCDFILIQCQPKRDLCVLLAIPVTRLSDEVYARLDEPVCSVDYRAWLTSPRKRVNLSQDPDAAYRPKNLPAVTVVMRNIPGTLRLTQVRAADEEKSDLDSNILLQTYVINYDSRTLGTGSVAWLQDQSSKDESFVYILQLNTRVSKVTNGRRIEDIRILSKCLFLKKNESDKNNPLGGLWHVDDLCTGRYNPKLHELFRKEPVPYEPIVTWDENFFGKTLITVDIVRNTSTQRRTYLHGHLTEFNGRPLGVPSALQSIFVPSLEEIWLRRRWISTLRNYNTFFTQCLGSILYSVKILPWLFTFLLDFPIQKLVALIRRNPVIGTAVMASLLYIGHPYPSVKLVVFFYLGCKCLPHRLLSSILFKEFSELA